MTNTTIANNLYPVANGTTSSLPFVDEFQPRDPTQYDIQYPIQKKWLNTVTNAFWELKNFTTSQGVLFANWVMIGAGIFTDTTYVEDTGDATPASGILYVLGSDGISTTGSGNAITIGIPGGIPVTTYNENSGSATPAGNILNVVGTAGIVTSGAGNTITISAAGTLANTYDENTGSATPSGGVLNVLGTAGITTSGSGNTITIQPTGIIATSYVGNTGNATPAGNVLNIVGTGGLVTAASGNTVTISVNSAATPAFFAYLETGVTNVTGDGTLYQVTFDSKLFDNATNYNTGTGLFTATKAGVYNFTSTLNLTGIGPGHGQGAMSLILNGSTFIQGNAGSPAGQSASSGGTGSLSWVVNSMVHMNVGDSIGVNFKVSVSTKTIGLTGTATFPGSYITYFSGSFLF